MELPKFEYFVNDYSNVLTKNEFSELNELAKSIEQSSGHQIVTLLFPHREGNELFDIALKAFNENKIGDKKRNDGILLAIATEEKKIRIIVGYGLEGEIPDLLASQMIEEQIRPRVNSGNFHQAIKNFYKNFGDYITNYQRPSFLREIIHNMKEYFKNLGYTKVGVIGILYLVLITMMLRGGREVGETIDKKTDIKKRKRRRRRLEISGFLIILVSLGVFDGRTIPTLIVTGIIITIISNFNKNRYGEGKSVPSSSGGNSSSDLDDFSSGYSRSSSSSSSSSSSFSGGGGRSGGGGAGD
ncbi:MAG: TPM domain-containing protein [candidate division SR1 bacterium]|nr:TPM domain-containing protein [candidate division SR1 bacterium]